jgi:hypothetical protein
MIDKQVVLTLIEDRIIQVEKLSKLDGVNKTVVKGIKQELLDIHEIIRRLKE